MNNLEIIDTNSINESNNKILKPKEYCNDNSESYDLFNNNS